VVLPLLLMVVFGIIEFGLLLYNKAMITNASREAARAGIVYNTDPTTGNLDRRSEAEMTSIVDAYCQGYLITFSSTSQEVETNTAPASPETMASGQSLTVTVTYHYDYLMMPAFLSNLIGGIDLVAVTTMRAE
ncbi:MAG: TadE/TadG family type IV pilus assembly protein, partial [Desulfuromonadaceae bacterium]